MIRVSGESDDRAKSSDDYLTIAVDGFDGAVGCSPENRKMSPSGSATGFRQVDDSGKSVDDSLMIIHEGSERNASRLMDANLVAPAKAGDRFRRNGDR